MRWCSSYRLNQKTCVVAVIQYSAWRCLYYFAYFVYCSILKLICYFLDRSPFPHVCKRDVLYEQDRKPGQLLKYLQCPWACKSLKGSLDVTYYILDIQRNSISTLGYSVRIWASAFLRLMIVTLSKTQGSATKTRYSRQD